MPEKISLCLIVGNEAERIVRCLASFGPAFDELCVVRAIGKQDADETLELAKEWCSKNGKECKTGEYFNRRFALDWPHVDNFAAARNKAFNLATGDWLGWCDADDIVSPDTPADRLREILAKTKANCVHFPYEVPGTNKAPYRERFVRRELYEKGRDWVFEVHENLSVMPEDGVEMSDAVVWLHAPEGKKTTGRERNKRILALALRDVPAKEFYLHQEFIQEGNKALAEYHGNLALAYHDLPPPFRFETLLNLGRIAKTRQEAIRRFGEAFALMPNCREPLVALTLAYFWLKDARGALATAEVLVKIPLPPVEERPWTLERKWYEWAGWDVYAIALRMNGRMADAADAQKKVHGPSPWGFGVPTITLCHATRARAQQAINARSTWLTLAQNAAQVEHIFAFDSDDEQSKRELSMFQHVEVKDGGSNVKAWNAAAAVAKGQLLVQLSDDWEPFARWDTALLQMIEESGKRLDKDSVVVAINDGHRKDDLLCMAILTRKRWIDQGREMFSPEYESVFSDNEFSHRAFRDGVVVDCRKEITFRHLHPAFGHGAMDETYAKGNDPERYRRGLATYQLRNPDAKPIHEAQITAILEAGK